MSWSETGRELSRSDGSNGNIGVMSSVIVTPTYVAVCLRHNQNYAPYLRIILHAPTCFRSRESCFVRKKLPQFSYTAHTINVICGGNIILKRFMILWLNKFFFLQRKCRVRRNAHAQTSQPCQRHFTESARSDEGLSFGDWVCVCQQL